MIFFYKANGKLINTTQQFVFQGSSKANTIYFVCPTSPRNLINVAFKLPNGESIPQQLMTLTEDTGLTGVFDVKGEIFAMWRFDIPSAITAHKGTVLAQFYITSQGEEVLATESATIVVQKGVSNIEPEQIDTYQAVLNVITQIYSEIDNFPEDYQTKTDNTLETESKEIVGAINELNKKVEQGGEQVDLSEYVQKVKKTDGTYKHGILGQDKNGVVSTTEVATNEARPYTMVQRTGGGIVLVGDLDASQPMPSKQAVNKKCLYDIVKPYKHIVYIEYMGGNPDVAVEIVFYSDDATPLTNVTDLNGKTVESVVDMYGETAVNCKLEVYLSEMEGATPEEIIQSLDIAGYGLTRSWDKVINVSIYASNLNQFQAEITFTDTVVMR